MTFPSPLMGFYPEPDTLCDVDNVGHLNSPTVTAMPPVSGSPDTDDLFFFRFPSIPTQAGPEGSDILFDFNHGCRIFFPPGNWQVKVEDSKSGHVFGDTAVQEGMVESQLKYFIPFVFNIYRDGLHVMTHEMNLSDQSVLISMECAALGDTLAWIPAMVRFQQRHGCRLTCRMDVRFHELFAGRYPHIRFITADQQDDEPYYASYLMNAGLGKDAPLYCPVNIHNVSLHHIGYHILGLPPDNSPAHIEAPASMRPIEEPYVCIAVQSTAKCKLWNNPTGWLEVVDELKARGYRVICIDRDTVTGEGFCWNAIPNGAENQTGPRPLSERLNWLRHAEFFIGLGSGLSWLAWTAGIPVVLISGFSEPLSEFPTPYRVINRYVCNSCWNDDRFVFDHKDYFWCPRHQGTSEQFICSRAITSRQVLNTINTIPNLSF